MSCLVILAAGLGSRFGGPKQLAEFGPLKRTLMEYNICHAYEYGFERVILIIQPQLRNVVEKTILPRLPRELKVCIAEQNNLDLPNHCTLPKGFEKPLGTAHALWCARSYIDSYFCVINGDDYYSRDAFSLLADNAHKEQSTIVSFRLDKTLSDFGGVNRGICSSFKQSNYEGDFLSRVDECLEIKKEAELIKGTLPNKKHSIEVTSSSNSEEKSKKIILTGAELVSMNCWGFKRNFEQYLERFLVKHFSNAEKNSECFLPDVVMNCIDDNIESFTIEHSKQEWFGVTYPDDSQFVERRVTSLTDKGWFKGLDKSNE